MNPADYRKELTAKIISQLEAGTAPWVKPWNPDLAPPGSPHNAVSGRPYHGGNHLWLQCQGYIEPRWCTYRQASEARWQVRRGEKATTVEYWQWSKDEKNERGETVQVKLDQPRVFYASVFNVAQMENVPEYKPPTLEWNPEEAAEHILKSSGAAIFFDKTDTAYYSPRHDQIHMPPKVIFPSAEAFYGVALHELGHWTGHGSRLNRDLVHQFGTPDYAKEELRAELSSYFLSARLGIPHDPGQHAAYIGSWIEALSKDHNEIFRAAKDAERICEFVLEFQREKTIEQETATVAEEKAVLDDRITKPQRARKPAKEMELEC
jgi:antirestriction protein ArdC